MPALTPQQLAHRLTFDFNLLKRMHSPLVVAEAYPSASALQLRQEQISHETYAARATFYRVTFNIKSLVGRGRYHDQFDMSLDLLSGGAYPFSAPSTHVISTPIPWSPHFAKGVPVCIGEFWDELHGRATIAHLIVHLCHLLNFDEQQRYEGYGGYNPEAVRYWTRQLHRRPITSNLTYPLLPTELTHDVPVSTSTVFRPAQPQNVQGGRMFRPARY